MDELAVGSMLAGYRIEAVVGRGGMGVVYRATQLRLRRAVALKVIATPFAQDEDFRLRFERESLLAAAIEHPNVVPIYEADEAEGRLFIAMRWVEGSDLGLTLARCGSLAPARVGRIARQVGSALDAAHRAGLVHRDVKPANILLAGDGEDGHEHVFLTDFGVSKQLDSETHLTRAGAFVGTVDYVAPEQVQKVALDGRADTYAMACVLFHALTGDVPFRSDNQMTTLFAHCYSPSPGLRGRDPSLPAAAEAVVRRGMAKAPKDRQASAGELGRAIASALEHTGRGTGARTLPSAPPPARPAPPDASTADASQPETFQERVQRGRSRRPWVLAAVPVIALVAGAAALLTGAFAGGGGNDIGVTRTIHDTGAFVRARLLDVFENPRPRGLEPPGAGKRYLGVRMAVTNLDSHKLSGFGAELITKSGKRINVYTAQNTCKGQRPYTGGISADDITPGATAQLCTIFTLASHDVPATFAFTPAAGAGRDTATWGLEQPTRAAQPRVVPGDCDAKGITRPPHREGTCTTPEGVRSTVVYPPHVLKLGSLSAQVLGIRTADVLVNPATGVRARPRGRFVLIRVRATNLLSRQAVFDSGGINEQQTELYLPGLPRLGLGVIVEPHGILEAFPAVDADPRHTLAGETLVPNVPYEGELVFDAPSAAVGRLRQPGSGLTFYEFGEVVSRLSSVGGINLCAHCAPSGQPHVRAP